MNQTNVLATDTWVSMGQEAEYQDRLRVFSDYRIEQETLAAAAHDVVVLHCLPAKTEEKEISAEVLDGPRSLIWTRPRTGCTCNKPCWPGSWKLVEVPLRNNRNRQN